MLENELKKGMNLNLMFIVEPGFNFGENGSLSAPLSHSAARHKMAIRPKRTHGAPRRRRVQHQSATSLPTTLEVNEEILLRTQTPENIPVLGNYFPLHLTL